MKNIFQYCRIFRAFDLDYLSIWTHAPGQSAYNPVERSMIMLFQKLAGITLPIERAHFQMSSGYGIYDNFQTCSEHTILFRISAQKVCHHYTIITNFKLYIINSIFACSSSLLNILRKVLNVSFALFTFFYKINLSIFRNIVQNFFMSEKCSVWFVWDVSRIFSCPEYVWFTYINFRYEKILDIIFDHFLKHFLNIFKYIWTDSEHFDNVFLTFLFYRED